MSLQTHLVELERKHRQLEEAIAQAVARPSSDDLTVVELKRKKLLLKEEMVTLRPTRNTTTSMTSWKLSSSKPWTSTRPRTSPM